MGMAIHYHLGQLANEDYSLNKQMKRKKKNCLYSIPSLFYILSSTAQPPHHRLLIRPPTSKQGMSSSIRINI